MLQAFHCLYRARLVLALNALMLTGCGGSNEGLVPVSGTVTFAGGPCPKPGKITFSPVSVEEGMPKRPGTADFSEDGQFEVSSFDPGDGLYPGTYIAEISCWEGQPSSDDPGSFERLNLVPSSYRPEVEVKSGGDPVELSFDVPKKQAAKR